MPIPHDAIVIGAGLAGLACAARLRALGHDPLLIEATHRTGGVIDHEETPDGFSIEWGPNTVRGSHAEALELADSLGLSDQRVAADPRASKRYILHPVRQKLVSVSPGPGILFSSLLGLRSKWRLLTEVLRPRDRRDDADDEAGAQVITRRLTREFADRIVGPVVSGIHAADIDQLSLSAAFPKMNAMERRYGGLVRGAIGTRRQRREEREATPEAYRPWRGKLYTYRHGFSQFIRAMTAAHPANRVLLRTAVDRVARDPATGLFEVLTRALDDPDRVTTLRHAHAVVVATPASAASAITQDVDRRLTEALAEIPYAPMAQVALGFRREQVGHRLDGFGFLIPRTADVRTLGCLFSSSLFPHRAPDGHVLLTAFIGGRSDPEAVAMGNAALTALALDDLRRVLQISGDPVMTRARRWHEAIPQYELGHADRTSECAWAEERRPGLAFIGSYRDGIGVGDVVRYALQRANSVGHWLENVKALGGEPDIMDSNAAPTEVMDAQLDDE